MEYTGNAFVMKNPKGSPGFTLIELIITLVVATVLLTVAVPSFQATIRNNRLVTQANDLVVALNTARSEAIKRGMPVTVCKSSDQSTCTPAAQWEAGWIVFSDLDGDGAFDGAPEEIILVSDGLEGDNTLRTENGNFSNFVSYMPSGASHGNPDNYDTFRLCDARGASEARAITISVTGRIRTEKGTSTCP